MTQKANGPIFMVCPVRLQAVEVADSCCFSIAELTASGEAKPTDGFFPGARSSEQSRRAFPGLKGISAADQGLLLMSAREDEAVAPAKRTKHQMKFRIFSAVVAFAMAAGARAAILIGTRAVRTPAPARRRRRR